MNDNRYGEQSHPPFRSQRLFSENGQWYFDTREGRQIGPYLDKIEVKLALAAFVAQRLVNLDKSRSDDIDLPPGTQDGIEHMVEELKGFFHHRIQNGQTDALLWANQRLRELMRDKENYAHRAERMEAIKYAINQEK